MRHHHLYRLAAAAFAAACLVACSGSPEPGPAAVAPPSAVAPPPAPLDEAELRRAASAALSEQRIYAPVGANAIEHYLALRELAPADNALAVALLELLPYAVIGSEQAMERGDLDEARRLVTLVEQVDTEFPALARLRDRIAATELREAQRAAQAAEAEAQRQQQALLAAQREAESRAAAAVAEAAPVASSDSAVPPVPAPPVAAPVAAPAAVAPPPVTAAAPPPTAAPPAPAVPRLLSAPSPRYPALALRRQLEGDVTVQFTIQPDGSVAEPRVLASSPPGVFDEAAMVATRRWQFEASGNRVQSTRVVQFRLGASQR